MLYLHCDIRADCCHVNIKKQRTLMFLTFKFLILLYIIINIYVTYNAKTAIENVNQNSYNNCPIHLAIKAHFIRFISHDRILLITG